MFNFIYLLRYNNLTIAMMDLSEKIKLILSGMNISPSIFADEIGIQRSSISHILAGRNKPSLDIVQKIVKRFPELGVDWVWDDQELPVINKDLNAYQSEPEPVLVREKTRVVTALQSPRKNDVSSVPVQENLVSQEQPPQRQRTVDKILVFYSDGTFQELKPAL